MRTVVVLAGIVAFALMLASTVVADNVGPVNFEIYTLGNVNGQDGWTNLGSSGAGCANYDVEVDTNDVPHVGFGAKTLRISNAVTSGCFSDQTFSKPLIDEAGEVSAENGGKSGGTRQNKFEAQWSFASTTTNAEQPGLSVVASPDRGDGARMSWVQMADTPSGLEVNFYEYITAGDASGCTGAFVLTNVASGLSRSLPHTIHIEMNFVDGKSNDEVTVTVDGLASYSGTSWEDYFRECENTESRTVDSILFRVGGAAAPATLGNGFVIDNLSLSSSTSVTLQAPTILSPANGSFHQSWNVKQVDWSDVTATNPPTKYQLEIYKDAGYTQLFADSGWIGVSQWPFKNKPQGSYFLRVRTKDNLGNVSEWSNGQLAPYQFTLDNTPPSVTINKPEWAVYAKGYVQQSDYTCEDSRSPIVSCVGTVANGENIFTNWVGIRFFSVIAVDAAGNRWIGTVIYKVADKHTCKVWNGWKLFKYPTFSSQAQCVSYFN